MHTIKDVAQAAGVSTATVSRCLNGTGYVDEQTCRHVLQIASDMNFTLKKYQPRNRHNVSTGIIGVLIPQVNAFFDTVIDAVRQLAEQNGMTLIVCDTQERPENEIRYLEMMSGIVNGLIIAPTSETAEYNAKYLKHLNEKVMPVVLLDRGVPLGIFDGVFIDGFHGAYSGVQALIDNGHKEIAIIAGPITCKPGLDRLNGYLEALKNNNLPIKEEYILYGDFQEKSAYELTNKLLKTRKSVTAIFSSNLVMSYGCLRAIDENQLKIPEDISFITFDDDLFFNFNVFKISCIFNPGFQAGEEAATSLINRIKSYKRSKSLAARSIILTPQLILRGSEKFPVNR